MASINGVSSNNTTSSLFNSVNRISGLASGLDTEGMIESLVKGYSTKIQQLNQKVTKTEWKQDAYRSIISKMVGFSSKYTSYTSNTNLMSPSFFSSAVKVLTKGEYKDSVTASGKTSSDISLDAVHQLATAAKYRTKSNLATGETGSITASKGINLSAGENAEKNIELSNLNGSLTLTYGSKTVSLNFNESTDVDLFKDARAKLKLSNDGEDPTDTEVLAEVINQKLADEKIVFTNGNSESADQRIKAIANPDGRIVLEEQGNGQNGVYISGASGNIGSQLGLSESDLKDAKEKKLTVLNTNTIKGGVYNGELTRRMSSLDYLVEKGSTTMNMSLDGTTKKINLPRVGKGADGQYQLQDAEGNALKDKNGADISEVNAENYTKALQEAVKDAFNGKVTVENKATDGSLQLEFKVKNEGSDLVINSDAGDALGIGKTATSYLNTSKTLRDLLGDDLNKVGHIAKDENEMPVLDEKTGKPMWDFTLNGVKIGSYTEDTKLSTILSDINSNADAGVQVAYSKTTQSFTFTAKETGAESKIEMGEGLAQAMFGSTEPSGENKPTFGQAYGASWLEDSDYVSFTTAAGTFKVKGGGSIEDVAGRLNNALSNFGQTAAYNKYSGQLEITDKNGAKVDFKIAVDGGSLGDIELKFDEQFATGISYTPGQDAKFTVTVNGEQKTMVRSSNSVSIDGLTISMNDTFNGFENKDGTPAVDSAGRAKNAVTFQPKTDSDKIIDAIKSMVDDYNSMMSEIKSAYSTMPYQKSNGAFGNYEPLTDEDREGMSESAIERYEAKAKQGILFGDRTLSTLYTKMSDAFAFSSRSDIDTLKDMGITVGFDVSSGTQSVQIDEDKLRSMLDSDPDRVANLFTKTDGIMDRMKTELDAYAKTTGEPKGTLIQQAGSPLSSLSLMNNTWQKEIDNYTNQIEKWQTKLEAQVERYTSQFSRLEQLINQMNSQSSTLAGLMGG